MKCKILEYEHVVYAETYDFSLQMVCPILLILVYSSAILNIENTIQELFLEYVGNKLTKYKLNIKN